MADFRSSQAPELVAPSISPRVEPALCWLSRKVFRPLLGIASEDNCWLVCPGEFLGGDARDQAHHRTGSFGTDCVGGNSRNTTTPQPNSFQEPSSGGPHSLSLGSPKHPRWRAVALPGVAEPPERRCFRRPRRPCAAPKCAGACDKKESIAYGFTFWYCIMASWPARSSIRRVGRSGPLWLSRQVHSAHVVWLEIRCRSPRPLDDKPTARDGEPGTPLSTR